MDKQRTIEKPVTLKGVGLHTGNSVEVTFKPAEADSGITFVRIDIAGKPAIKAGVDQLRLPSSASPRCSTIGSDTVQVQTIEHLMAGLAGLGIDNVTVEINSVEAPGLDGSSKEYVNAFLEAGIKEQGRPRNYYCVKEPLFVQEGKSSVVILPGDEFKISYTLDYDNILLEGKFLELTVTEESFKKELSSARTFCLEEEVLELKKRGFGKGATYDNTLVIGKKGVLNTKLRYADEFVRHKVLDLIGDLYLLGAPIKGHVIALKSGHYLNTKLLQKIARQRQKEFSLKTPAASPAGQEVIEGKKVLDITAIKDILPHREPFLLVDRITDLEMGKRVVGIKNVTINDYFFKGHFPQRPVMPGVLIIEAMAQAGGVMMLSLSENRGKIAFFMAINNVKFRKTVVPGDQLVLRVEAVKIKSRTGQLRGEALVDGKVVAEADFMFVLADEQE
ncbi:MAG: bifunctional UDP-3-O-[3-hydroxymyristoyl] N-acetylglucosamine deacetylase/3-hydroxyacyl-ACP dehydratase [Candidatus Omnitrophota bacterium]|jgi:UDP-3-O-[3-hydroxymyristoyl] N-acetylglucosamine deacetylase/3-hydroxyacyl-[acyl-carrier-protein] dehydratase